MTREIRDITNHTEIEIILNKYFTNKVRTSYVEIGEEKVCLPVYYKDCAKRIQQFEVRDNDVFITSHPKTGTTWTQEMVWLISNDLNYEGAKSKLRQRFVFLDKSILSDLKTAHEVSGAKLFLVDQIDYANGLKERRFIKSHLPWFLLPEQIQNSTKKPKVIHIARNPKDTCVSYYHHCKHLEGYTGNFDDFCKLFLTGKVSYGPFWTNILSYWENRNKENVLFLKFEDMKNDLPSVIRTTANFLGKSMTDEEVQDLVKHLDFGSMRKNPAVNYEDVVAEAKSVHQFEQFTFLRSGNVGSYKAEMSADLIKAFDVWSSEEEKKSGLLFGLLEC